MAPDSFRSGGNRLRSSHNVTGQVADAIIREYPVSQLFSIRF